MRRALALGLIGCIFAALAVPYSSGGCCQQPGCCKDGLCPMRAHHSSEKPHDSGMDCHQQSPAASPCAMQSACGHNAQAGLASALPLGVLQPLAGLQEPLRTHRALIPTSAAAHSGFNREPFQPPRS